MIKNKEDYIIPVVEVSEILSTGVLCQSSLGDVGGGSLNWGGSSGNDPIGNGDDFSWGN